MRMDRRKTFLIFHFAIVLISTLILAGCGQVGFITGGPVDNAAPKPIENEVDPPIGTKNIKPERIVIPFDEFIALNNPGQNIRVVPEDVRLEPKIRKKSLVLTPIKGEWQDTTTYAIYLKRAVKDITEGNDSLMIYVFATGNILDSLEAAVRVIDAYTNEPAKDVTVGLFTEPLIDDTSKTLPRYVGITDSDGLATFKYLKKGPFYAYAYLDENKNNVLDPREKRGMYKNVIYGDTVVDIVPEIRLMSPPPSSEFKIKTNEILPPAAWSLSFNQPVTEEARLSFIDFEPVGEWWNPKRDSAVFYFGEVPRSGKYKLAMDYGEFQDTILKKFFLKQAPEYDLTTNLNRGILWIGDTLTLSLSEAIETWELANVIAKGKNEDDTLYTEVALSFEKVRPNALQVFPNPKMDSILITLLPNSIDGYNLKLKDTIEVNYINQKQEKVGILIIEMDTIPGYGILELLDNKKELVKQIFLEEPTTVEIENLQPGAYTFRFILDKNRDGRWTTGDIFKGTEAEKVIWFKSASNVRANWDVKTELDFSKYLETPEEEETEENTEGEADNSANEEMEESEEEAREEEDE